MLSSNRPQRLSTVDCGSARSRPALNAGTSGETNDRRLALPGDARGRSALRSAIGRSRPSLAASAAHGRRPTVGLHDLEEASAAQLTATPFLRSARADDIDAEPAHKGLPQRAKRAVWRRVALPRQQHVNVRDCQRERVVQSVRRRQHLRAV